MRLAAWLRSHRLCLSFLLAPLVLACAGCSPRPGPARPQPPGTSTAPATPAPGAPAAPSPEPAPSPPADVKLSDPERDAVLFEHWRARRGPEVEAFESFLVYEKVAKVVPTYQLLRSASMWKECRADPFELPPPQEWEKVRDVLVLLRELRERQVLPTFEVVSAYRDPKLNRCAGGAPRSSHMQFAVDIAPLSPAEGERLCRFWREHGKAWDMGVSRYPSGRIHIDRTGWRTWGASHRRGSSYCLR